MSHWMKLLKFALISCMPSQINYPLSQLVLKNLILFATKKSHFVFDGQYYDQIDGVAMGSPLGPVLANIFMCDFEGKSVMKNINQPTIWFRYVDDTFTLFKNKNGTFIIFFFLHYLNWRDNNIKFTIEFEQNDEIPFLDILLKRNLHSSFSTSINRKKTFTGLYTKWDSFTPRKYKINLVRTFAYRCIRIRSSPRLLQFALDDLKRNLLLNSYPMGTVKYQMNDVIERHQNKPKDPVQTVKKKEVLIVLPFLGHHSKHFSIKTAEVLYEQILWYFQHHNSFSEHPKNQVLFPLQR